MRPRRRSIGDGFFVGNGARRGIGRHALADLHGRPALDEREAVDRLQRVESAERGNAGVEHGLRALRRLERGADARLGHRAARGSGATRGIARATPRLRAFLSSAAAEDASTPTEANERSPIGDVTISNAAASTESASGRRRILDSLVSLEAPTVSTTRQKS